jgi:hypothetical protein
MMYNRVIKIVVLFLISTPLFSQESILKDYDWEKKMLKYETINKYEKENEVVLNKTIKIEYFPLKEGLTQYFLSHQVIYVNSDDAVNNYNKIYLPSNNDEKLVKCKVRVRLKNGKEFEVNTNDTKEEIDEEKDVKYTYFAVNGLEKGAILEQFFLFEQTPDLKGKTIFMQGELPIDEFNFNVIYPKHLVFKTKSYNGLLDPTIDSEKYSDKTVLSIVSNNVTALKDDDKFSNWKNNVKMFRFKLDENTVRNTKNLYNFKTFSTNVYENLNLEIDKKSIKSIDDFLKSINESTDLQATIWSIEDKIKKNINFSTYFDTKENLSKVIETKQANQSELVKLFINSFKKFNIQFEIVFASDRFSVPFDKDFESYENLDEVLFYFPKIDKFLYPTGNSFRIPLIPSELADNNGLFIKTKEYSGVTMPFCEINKITILDGNYTKDIMNIEVDFTKDLQNPIIKTSIQFGGYSNVNLQPIKDFVDKEQYQSILKDIAENYTGSTEFLTLETKNDGLEFMGKLPFTLNVSFEGKNLIKKAAENYLFTIGETIGRQTELYQESSRKLPVEINFPHTYMRKITLILPDNITVKNLDKLIMNNSLTMNNKKEAGFSSTYKKEGNNIIVENSEYYNVVKYPLEYFDTYKSIINAAADFNKLVLVLTKN